MPRVIGRITVRYQWVSKGRRKVSQRDRADVHPQYLVGKLSLYMYSGGFPFNNIMQSVYKK